MMFGYPTVSYAAYAFLFRFLMFLVDAALFAFLAKEILRAKRNENYSESMFKKIHPLIVYQFFTLLLQGVLYDRF